MDFTKILSDADRLIEKGEYSLAVFVMRDYFPRENPLWGMCYDLGHGYCPKSEALWIREELEKLSKE